MGATRRMSVSHWRNRTSSTDLVDLINWKSKFFTTFSHKNERSEPLSAWSSVKVQSRESKSFPNSTWHNQIDSIKLLSDWRCPDDIPKVAESELTTTRTEQGGGRPLNRPPDYRMVIRHRKWPVRAFKLSTTWIELPHNRVGSRCPLSVLVVQARIWINWKPFKVVNWP